jgi:hypothetical protein
MRADAPLIDHPDQATPEWLTAALVASGRAPAHARITDVSATVIGRGKVGQNVRFTLDWEGAAPPEVPASVVGKFASDDPTSRQAGLMTGTYLREVSFYREVAPRVAMSIPGCHVAELDATSGAFVLLFDDITPAESGDQVAGCTLTQAEAAMDELARLHAGFWGDRSLEGGEWLVRRGADGGAGLVALYEMFVGSFLDRFGPRLSPEAVRVVEAFTPLVGPWIATDADPLTLLHGDYRLENMLFATSPELAPLTVVDWQTPSLGPGPSDAAYFLGAGLPTEMRRTHERDLLERYRQGLVAGGVDLSTGACWASYRANAVAGVHMTVVASVLVGQDDHGDAMFLAMAERHAAHVADLDTLALLAQRS